MKMKSLLPALLLAGILAACGQQDSKSTSAESSVVGIALADRAMEASDSSLQAYDSLSKEAAIRLQVTMQGLVLRKSANINAQVSKIPQTVASLEELVALSGGYVVSSGVSTDEISNLRGPTIGDSLTSVLTRQQHGSVSIAIPASRFEELLGKLNGVAWKIEARELTQDNVGLELKKASLTQEEQHQIARRQEARTVKNSKHEHVVKGEFDKADLSEKAARQARNHMLDLNQEIAWSAVTIGLTAPPETVVQKQLDPDAFTQRLMEDVRTDYSPWVLGFSLLLNAGLTFQWYRQRAPYVVQA